MAEEQRDISTPGCRLKAAPENGTNMEEMELSGSDPRAGMGRGLGSSQAGTMREFWGRRARQPVRKDLKEGQLHDGEPQFHGLVETMESPLSGRSNTPQGKLSPAEYTKAFLLPCKGTATTCQQPRETKAAQASVGLCMESEGTDGGFRSENKIGSKKVKKETRDEEDPTLDVHRQRFRQLRYWEAEGPREVCRSLQELCHQWLKPDKHTKEQILELVVLEQFLAILPPELRSWLQGHSPETCSQAVALAEDFLLRQQEDKRREEKESFRKIIVNLPEEGATPSFLVIKQESDWDTSSLGDGTAFGQDQRKQPKNTGKLEEQGILSGRTKQDTSCCPGQGETSQRLKECLSEKEEGNFINSQGQYEEPEDKAAPPRVIQDERLKTCPDCGKGFVWLYQVIEHQRTHTGERPYACSYCGKSFSSKSYVIKHERIHTGEKPYQCSDCERGFSRRDVLVAHRKTHTGEKPYSCLCCGQNFGTRECLLVHERTHTGEKPYKCPECERCFRDRSSFYAHKRTHRGGKTKKATGLWENA